METVFMSAIQESGGRFLSLERRRKKRVMMNPIESLSPTVIWP